MQGFKEFTDLSARTKEIEFETKIQSKNVKGTFLVKFPSLKDRIAIETKLSQLIAGADVNNIKTKTYSLAEAICYLERLIVKKPDWFDFKVIDDPDTVISLYDRVLNFINSFRKEDGSNESERNSGKSMDKEPMEGK